MIVDQLEIIEDMNKLYLLRNAEARLLELDREVATRWNELQAYSKLRTQAIARANYKRGGVPRLERRIIKIRKIESVMRKVYGT